MSAPFRFNKCWRCWTEWSGHYCRKAMVRMDAGYPAEALMRALEDRRTPYVARIKANSVLEELAEPGVDEAVLAAWDEEGEEGKEARMWTWEPSTTEPLRGRGRGGVVCDQGAARASSSRNVERQPR